jgi:hypothetical protein
MADNTNTLQLTLQVKDDGSVVVDQVHKKFDEMEKGTVSGGKSIGQTLGGIKAGWLAVAGGAAAAYMTLSKFLEAASEAEEIESRLAFQAGTVGYNFQQIKPYVDDFANSIQRTTRFSDEMAREGLTQMLQYTSDVEQGMNGVRLAMDMSTQTGMDFNSTSRYIGMAMAGNVEMLGRWIPELRDLEGKLGADATAAEKAQYALGILNEKFAGAAEKDLNTYAGQLANLKNKFDDLKESAGRALLPIAQFGLSLLKRTFDVFGGAKSPAEMAAEEEAKRRAQEQASVAAAAKAYADDLANWKKTQDQRQQMNFQFAMQEWQTKKDTMALIDAEEFQALEKAKKIGADLDQIRQVYHLKRLEQIRKEKEEEQNAMLSLATMWKGYYDERIAKENEIINLVKGLGIETTVGTRFEFAGIEEQFRKISQKASMFTEEEFEKIKAAYVEKLKGVAAWEGGTWEEISVPTGKEFTGTGYRTTWGTDWRWKENMMTEEQRRIEQMREESLARIEMMGKGAETGAPGNIIEAFDQTRDKALELQLTIEQIKNEKLQIDTSRLVDAMNQIGEFEDKLIRLVQGQWNLQVGIEIVGDELIQRIEQQLSDRYVNKQSQLRATIEGGVTTYSNY